MKRPFSFIFIPLVILSLVSCSSSSKKQTPPPGYVSKGTSTFQLQPYKEVTLENGLKIYFIHDHSLPRISMTMLFKTGAMQEASKFAGLNALTAYLLEQGTLKRSAMQIADDFGQMGTSLDVNPGADVTTVYADALSIQSDMLLDLFADVTTSPAFKDPEINRIRAQMIAALQKKIDNPSAYADLQMDQFLYGAHPYGRDENGTIEGLRASRKQEVIRHYLTFYRPNNATLAVVGKFSEDFVAKVQSAYGKWARRTIPVVKVEAPPPIEGLQMKLVLKRGLQQTQIRIAELGIPRSSEDFLRLRLANEALGGGFASRLNQKVRDDLGLTYSIYSGFDARKERGSFDISTFTKNETAGKTVEETLAVLANYLATGAEEKEVAASRNQLIGQFPRAIETADRLAYNLLALDFYGIPVEYLTNYNKNVMAISATDAHEAMKRAVSPKNVKVLVYGDEKIASQFEKFKPQIVHVR